MGDQMKLLICYFAITFFVTASSQSCSVSDADKNDCGFAGIDQNGCESKGCCWSPAGDNSATPWCFYAAESTTAGYSLSSIVDTTTGFSGVLDLIGEGDSEFGTDIKQLSLDVIYESASTAHVKITDASSARWEIPQSVIKRPIATGKPEEMLFEVTTTESPFSLEVTRKADKRSIFKTSPQLKFKDQYIEFTTSIDPNAKTFGLGESTRLEQALKVDSTHSLWAADIAALTMYSNLYGSFPFYLQMVDGKAHGVLLMNSNGMDITLNSDSITYKVLGGVVDLYFFTGDFPADVISQYLAIVGKPAMVPYWSLGFHNCKYGYTSVGQVEEVVQNYTNAGIPLDTQWMDIDYMQNYRDFTYDAVNFPQSEVASFVDTLHENGQHFVPIVDPGIMVYSGYEAYEEGMKQDLFVKDISGGYYLGQVWPGPTYFPDFLHPKAQDYWTKQLSGFYDLAPVDGLWIDMNEVSNFCNSDGTGQVCANTAESGCPAPGASQTDCCLECSTVDATNKYDFPPYNIGNTYGKLSTKTMSMSATQYGDVPVYNTHNLYGLTEQIATNKALTEIRGKRPFLLTRSSFLSSGVHTAKWTGDNGATWDDLRSSVVSIMDFNMFGVPMIGADICGFIYDTTEELCARWIEVGAFYPFSRNHNAIGQTPQELYLWESVTEAAKNALSMRYQLLPYMYTQFYHASRNEGLPLVVASLWVNFPDDEMTLTTDSQFMIGSGVLISPVLDQGADYVDAYFPQGLWYNFATRSKDIDASAGGLKKTLDTPLTSTNVHVRGGSILPLQQAAMTTTASRKTPFTILVATDSSGAAAGDLFWDDGEQVELTRYLKIDYSASVQTTGNKKTLSSFKNMITVIDSTDGDEVELQNIEILGFSLVKPSSASLNGVALKSSQIVFDEEKGSIVFSNLNLKLVDPVELEWK